MMYCDQVAEAVVVMYSEPHRDTDKHIHTFKVICKCTHDL